MWKKIWKREVYEANDKGQIRNSITGRILKQRKKKSGYLYVKLCPKYNEKREYLSHRVICMAFNKGYKISKVVNHKNKNRLDNRPNNLEWVTHKKNAKHRDKQYLNY